mmetsp:Transcript_20271/g.22646  ORF Transcript_20271/g.22646 Transcript_20271/m.22646 type:complete len:381 (+) Transcript_20271:143-1285(+)
MTDEENEAMRQEGLKKLEKSINTLKENPIVDLTNFQDLQYYGPATVGSEDKSFNMVYDTGSSWFWIPGKGCTGCPTKNSFDQTTSSTFTSTGERKELSYGKGFASGIISTDQIGLKTSESTNMRFNLIDSASDFEGTKADGILGMTPTTDDGADLFVTKLSEAGVISGQEFTVFIGKEGKDKSWIEFGKNIDDQENVTYVDLSPLPGAAGLTYWSADFDKLETQGGTVQLSSQSTIWDTGTSLIGLNQADFVELTDKMANGKQKFNFQDQFIAVRCGSINEISPLKFTFGEKEIIVDPHALTLRTNGFCVFLVQILNLPAMLLGDSFLRGNKIIHDMEGQRLGLFPQIFYNYSGSGRNLLFLWIILGVGGFFIIGIGGYC